LFKEEKIPRKNELIKHYVCDGDGDDDCLKKRRAKRFVIGDGIYMENVSFVYMGFKN
jgi:hypothetical protein